LKPGDILIVDRGFRDVVAILEALGWIVLMPALKGNRKQLTTVESNESRRVTKMRSPVEAIHGIVGQRNKLLHHQVDNKLLPDIGCMCRITCFINNKFGQRLESDKEDADQILKEMNDNNFAVNTLAQEVEENRWGRRNLPFQKVSSSAVEDFPEMTEHDLKVFSTGTYQLKQSVSYLAEVMNENNEINMEYANEAPNILRIRVPSRQSKSTTYKCFIEYVPNGVGCGGVKRHCCDCANGNRTIGCCAHLAAIIYYLSRYARYLAKIVKPAEILSKLFLRDQHMPVINDDSDED